MRCYDAVSVTFDCQAGQAPSAPLLCHNSDEKATIGANGSAVAEKNTDTPTTWRNIRQSALWNMVYY